MEIIKKLTTIASEMEAIGKTGRNQAQGYNFRAIDEMLNVLHPLFAKHGVVVAPQVLSAKKEQWTTKSGSMMFSVMLNVEYCFYADDGSSIRVVTIGEAMDSGDKASNKAMSAALKYALIQVLLIPTEGDNDTENHSPEVVKGKPAASKEDMQRAILAIKNGKENIIEKMKQSRILTTEQEMSLEKLYEIQNTLK